MKAFIFDMDGVIIDSEPIHLHVMQQVMNKHNISVPLELFEQYTGMTSSAVFAALIKRYNLPGTPQQMTAEHMAAFKRYIVEHNIQPIKGIRSLLAQLNERGIAAAIASSSPLDVIEFVTEQFNIKDCFKFLTSGEDVANGKPAPDIYLTTAQKLSLPPRECVVLEDSRNGSIAAKEAGMYCIGFVNPNSGNQDLSHADETVNDIAAINLDKLF